MFVIDTRSRVPIYEQLEQNIISLIASGVLSADDQLPGVRSLARDLGINPNTVQRAYQELEAQELIYQAAGRGSFIAPGDNPAKAIIRRKLEEIKECALLAKKAGANEEEAVSAVRDAFDKEVRQ